MSVQREFDWSRPRPPMPPHVRGLATSRAAAERVRDSVPSKEERVYRAIRAAGAAGMTCDEAEAATGLSHQTTSARCRGLVEKGRIATTDRRRPTRAGCPAVVYVATNPGEA